MGRGGVFLDGRGRRCRSLHLFTVVEQLDPLADRGSRQPRHFDCFTVAIRIISI